MAIPVAVIIPTFNRLETLPRALDSVLDQTLTPQEICLVDDGSSDGTEAFIQKHYPQLQYCYQQNRGVSSARNLGVQKTSAPWLAFLDSDDEWLPFKLEKQYEVIQNDPQARLIHSDEIWIRNGRRVNPMSKHRKQGGDVFMQSLSMCAISPSAVVLQRALFDEAGGFDENLPACEDYDLWLRVCSRHPVSYVETALLKKYGGHEDQLSRQHWGMDRFRVQALKKLLVAAELDVEKRSAALAMLQQKCGVLIAGAKKRGNEELLASCLALLQEFGIGYEHCA